MAIYEIDINTGEVKHDKRDTPEIGNPDDFNENTPLPFDIRDIQDRVTTEITPTPDTTNDRPKIGRDLDIHRIETPSIRKPYKPPRGQA